MLKYMSSKQNYINNVVNIILTLTVTTLTVDCTTVVYKSIKRVAIVTCTCRSAGEVDRPHDVNLGCRGGRGIRYKNWA